MFVMVPRDRVFVELYESFRLIWMLDVSFRPLFCLPQDNGEEIEGMFKS